MNYKTALSSIPTVQPTVTKVDLPEEKKEYTGIIISSCDADFSPKFSDEAYLLLKKRTGKERHRLLREDQDMVSIVEELGVQSWARCGRDGHRMGLSIVYIESRFKSCYEVSQYDGCESLKIDYSKYRIDSINDILTDSDLSSEEKLILIAEAANAKIDSKMYHEKPWVSWFAWFGYFEWLAYFDNSSLSRS